MLNLQLWMITKDSLDDALTIASGSPKGQPIYCGDYFLPLACSNNPFVLFPMGLIGGTT